MSTVNEQFNKLFKKIKDTSYPNKSIKAALLLLLSATFVQNTFRFIIKFYPSFKLVFEIILVVTVEIEACFFMMFSLFLLYLADVKFVNK